MHDGQIDFRGVTIAKERSQHFAEDVMPGGIVMMSSVVGLNEEVRTE